jgi:hypothetical protein
MALQQARLILPAPCPSGAELRAFWVLIRGDPEGLTDANDVFCRWVQPFLIIGAYNARSEAFRGYRSKLSKKGPELVSYRYSTRSKDELMDWLQASPDRPRLFSASYRYWSRFPEAWIATYLHPVEVTLIAEKVLTRHQAIEESTAADRRALQELADEAVGLLERPPKLEEYRQLQARRAA